MAKKSKKDWNEWYEEQAVLALANAKQQGYLTLSRLGDHKRHNARLRLSELLEMRWKEDRIANHAPAIIVTRWSDGDVIARAVYGHIGNIEHHLAPQIARSLLSVAGADNSVRFIEGETSYGFYEDSPDDFYVARSASAAIILRCTYASIPDVVRLLNDLILDHAR